MASRVAVKVLEADIEREDEVVLLLGERPVRCMISHCPNAIYENNMYLVNFTIQLSDEYMIMAADGEAPTIENIDNGFRVLMQGKLNNSVLHSTIDFDDGGIHYDHPELNGKMITLYAERIEASFD